MTTDLIERLRNTGHAADNIGYEAADEIERLYASVAEYQKEQENDNAEIERLTAELAEYKKMLDWIRLQGDEFSQGVLIDQPGDGEYFIHGMNSGGQDSDWYEALRIAIQGEQP